MNAPDTITMAELARLFRVSRRTINRWVTAGILPPPLPRPRRLRLWLTAEIAIVIAHAEAKGQREEVTA